MALVSHGNFLLNSLAPDALASLAVQEEDYEISTVLIAPGETPDYVYFPLAFAVVSVVRYTAMGTAVESGLVGSEGLLHVQTAITTPAPAESQGIVQVKGRIARAEQGRLRALFGSDAAFRDSVLAFTSFFVEQLTQNLVCNRLHAIEQRLAKWLLMARDRIETDELHLTHEFLSHMLGVHRPGVSVAVKELELDGLIDTSRNRLTIRDCEGLLKRSCECYGLVHVKLRELVGSAES